MKTKTKVAGLTAACVVASPLLTACFSNATPSIGQCAAVTGRGFGDKQDVKRIVDPGEKVGKGDREIAWYFPCNARNYVTGHEGDRNASQGTKLQGDSNSPGTPVYVYSTMPFQLNQNTEVLKEWFAKLCLKYGCAETSPQENSDNADKLKSSDPGWNEMLREQVGPAIDRAFQEVMENPANKGKFGPNTWTLGGWPDLDKAVSAQFPTALQETSGLKINWLCSTGSDEKTCGVPQIHFTAMAPTSPTIEQQYDQQVAAEQAAAVNAKRLEAARKIYGGEANYWLGLQDTIRLCQQSGKTCTLYVGKPNTP
jgi:hypothetical protein